MYFIRTFHPSRFSGFVLLSLLLFSFVSQIDAQQRLIIVGGGTRPTTAMSKFVEWAGRERARILIIPWATAEPEESFAYLKKDLAAFNPQAIELAPIAPFNEEKKIKFLNQIKSATGVFFTGGDQVRIMDVLKDESLLQILKQRYAAGVVFGGTSAGTAIMSSQMITGEGDFTVIDGGKVQTSLGLGLLPDNVVVDQHFIKRQRENRLFGLILQNPRKLGIGIDESTALLVTDNRFAEIIGSSQVMLVSARESGGRQALTVYLLQPGEKFDLRKRAPEKRKSVKQSK